MTNKYFVHNYFLFILIYLQPFLIFSIKQTIFNFNAINFIDYE